MNKKYLIVILSLIMFSIILGLCIAFYMHDKINKFEAKLKETYSEVVYIKNSQFIVSDKKGDIHLINMSGKTQILLSLQDIESGLNRDFTLKDISKPDLKLKHNFTNK